MKKLFIRCISFTWVAFGVCNGAQEQVGVITFVQGEKSASCSLDAIEPFTCAAWQEIVEQHTQAGSLGCIIARVMSQGFEKEHVHYVDAAHLHAKLYAASPYPTNKAPSVVWANNPMNGKPITKEIDYFVLYADAPATAFFLGTSADVQASTVAGNTLRTFFDALYHQDAARKSKAVMMLGDMHRVGKHGVRKDASRALTLYRHGAAQSTDRSVAAQCASAAADLCYAGADGVAADFAQAVSYYKQAVMHGDAALYRHGAMRLGSAYLAGGAGLAPDYGAAVHWYEKLLAVITDDKALQAQIHFELGKLHHLGGHGLKPGYAKAAAHYEKAYALSANQQDIAQVAARSALALGELYKVGDARFAQHYTHAATWYARARDQQHDKAARSLACLALGGICCQGGCGLPQNMGDGARAYALVENDENEHVRIVAQHELAKLYRTGAGVPKDLERSVSLYKNVAQQQVNVQARQEARAALQEIKQETARMIAQVDELFLHE